MSNTTIMQKMSEIEKLTEELKELINQSEKERKQKPYIPYYER